MNIRKTLRTILKKAFGVLLTLALIAVSLFGLCVIVYIAIPRLAERRIENLIPFWFDLPILPTDSTYLPENTPDGVRLFLDPLLSVLGYIDDFKHLLVIRFTIWGLAGAVVLSLLFNLLKLLKPFERKFLKAKILAGKDDWAGSLEMLKVLHEQKPERTDVLLRIGITLFELGDLEGAKTSYSQAINLGVNGHDHFYYWYQILLIEEKLGMDVYKDSNSLETLIESIEFNTDEKATSYASARVFVKDFLPMIMVVYNYRYQQLLKHSPHDPKVLNTLEISACLHAYKGMGTQGQAEHVIERIQWLRLAESDITSFKDAVTDFDRLQIIKDRDWEERRDDLEGRIKDWVRDQGDNAAK